MTELLIILLLIAINGVLALTETAFVSARTARLMQLAEEGSRGAQTTLRLAEQPTTMLSAIQVGITLIGILAGAFGGATIAAGLADTLRANPTLAPHADTLAFALVVIFTTYLSVVVGELIPKRLALLYPEAAAVRLVPPIYTLSHAAAPIVRLLSLSTDAMLWLMGVRRSEEAPVSEEEIEAMVRQGVEAGVFEEVESAMVSGLFSLGDLRIAAVMTPRTEITWLDLDDPPEVNQQKLIDSHYSRLPVARGDLDHVAGLVRAKDLLRRCLQGEPFDLEASLLQAMYVPENATGAQALEQFKATGWHMALVLDEHGGIAGLVTLLDLTTEIVGEIGAPQAVQRDDGSWLLDGLLPVDDVKEMFDIVALPDEDSAAYQTLGGLVMTALGRIPHAADSFVWGGLRFEVVDMDGRRVDKVLVQRVPPADDDA